MGTATKKTQTHSPTEMYGHVDLFIYDLVDPVEPPLSQRRLRTGLTFARYGH